MQEDNEFRFQELEQKKTDAGVPTDRQCRVGSGRKPASPPPAVRRPDAATEEEEDAPGVPMEPEVLVDNGTGDPAEVPSGTGGAEGLGARRRASARSPSTTRAT